jgi:hypothetical protein
MRKFLIGLAALVILAALGAGALLILRPAPESPPVAIERVPIAPAPAPVAVAPKRPDLPTVEVGTHPVHPVPDGPPPADKPITLRTQDGRPIDPTSGRVR